MAGLSVEYILIVVYAVFLGLIALVLEALARHVRSRSQTMNTIGFTYHADRDIWSCPRDQHLFPTFADSQPGKVVYRAPASVCNSCRSKAACTDSTTGREIERMEEGTVESGMKRFHRALSLMLLCLSGLLLVVEFFRTPARDARLGLVSLLLVLVAAGWRLMPQLRKLESNGMASEQR
ncbi:MAG TPA: hypothetical protein VFE22_12320 [Edaphobacter sp.]|nr:hypothetical protein [Edaphobacter sp.]